MVKRVKALERAVKLAGGQTALARQLSQFMRLKKPLKQAHIYNWLYRDKTTPYRYVIPIEKLLDGKVTRHQLRPDVYPDGQ